MNKQQWDENFSDDDYVYGEKPNAFIEQMSDLLKPQSEVGCFAEGEGRNAVYLAREGHTVTAYDYSTVGLRKTKELAVRSDVNVETVLMDLTRQQPTPKKYDAAIMVFGHVFKEDQRFLFDGLIRTVKPGGFLIAEVYSVEQLKYGTGGPPDSNMLYDPTELLDWIEGHEVLHFYYGEAERREGKRHTGTGHVIQIAIHIDDEIKA